MQFAGYASICYSLTGLQFSVSLGSFSRSILSLSKDSFLRETNPAILSEDWLVALSACEDTDLSGLPSLCLPYVSLFGACESHMIPDESACLSLLIPSGFGSLGPKSFFKKEDD